MEIHSTSKDYLAPKMFKLHSMNRYLSKVESDLLYLTKKYTLIFVFRHLNQGES